MTFLVLTADDRHAGKVSDGRQTIGTAVAIVETGEIGLARGAPRGVDRGNDSVSRYGLGASLAQVPAAYLAPGVERKLGPGTSQPLFLLAPLAAVLLAALSAGATARFAGASGPAERLALVLCVLGSPLGAYATSEFSEPLQAAALGGAAAFAFGAARAEDPNSARRLAAGAGAAAGFAVLLKSSLAAVSPFLLLPLLAVPGRRVSLPASAGAGALLPLLTWLGFEIARFGRPFGGYAGEGFSHPLLDGAWRLLVGPNRGLLLFFPAAALAVVGLTRAIRVPGDPTRRLAAIGSLSASAALLVTASAWWAWHGVGGWGPRFLVPAIPLLAPWAVLVAERLSTGSRRLLLGASIALNVPPLLVHPSLVDTYVANCRRPALTPQLARQVPALAVDPDDAGRPSVPPDQVLSTLPAASPHILYPWYFAASAAGSAEAVAARLQQPPWYERHPELGPRLVPFPPELASIVAPPPRWNVLGRSLWSGVSDPASGSVYLGSLTEQILRAHETGHLDRALALAEKLVRLWPGEMSDALLLESFRLLGRTEIAETVFRSLPRDRAGAPPVLAVVALLARDLHDVALATRLGVAAAPYFPGTPLGRLARLPSSWPNTYAELTRPEPPSGKRPAPGKGSPP
ncbi:MAG TPA: hypothetical protein VE129_15345 [Thermoanaerobaculia bacterium]|nr:hypothetical protein [Thermoanaerobaculia bacterium]